MTTEHKRNAAVNEALLKLEGIPRHGIAAPAERRVLEALYMRAFREGRDTLRPLVAAQPAAPDPPANRWWNQHVNQLGDWCPWSGRAVPPGTPRRAPCPALCPDSTVVRRGKGVEH